MNRRALLVAAFCSTMLWEFANLQGAPPSATGMPAGTRWTYSPNFYRPSYSGLGYGSGTMGYGYQSNGYGIGYPYSAWHGSYYQPWNGYYGSTLGLGSDYGSGPYLFNSYLGYGGYGYRGSYFQNFAW
ncbi:MAG TPA: hypothetical protein VG713_07465 [Pirellulales bacterium]|nr:hypothetical protein [Pirellulales bacterium]